MILFKEMIKIAKEELGSNPEDVQNEMADETPCYNT